MEYLLVHHWVFNTRDDLQLATTHSMVDFFMILMVPNAGDGLQGINRGITELVDGIVINKDDGESRSMTMKSKQYYMSALSILRSDEEFWKPRVLTCSAIEKIVTC